MAEVKRKRFKSFGFVPGYIPRGQNRKPLTKGGLVTEVQNEDGSVSEQKIKGIVLSMAATSDGENLFEMPMSESTLTHKTCTEESQAYNFINLDMSVLVYDAYGKVPGSQAWDDAEEILEGIIKDGFYLPLKELEGRGYRKHPEATVVTHKGKEGPKEYVRFNAYIASTSDLRNMRCTATDWPFETLAPLVTENAEYLTEATHNIFQAFNRFALVKSNGITLPRESLTEEGMAVRDFDFTYDIIPDFTVTRDTLAIHYDSRTELDGQNLEPETRPLKYNLTDGCGFISPEKAEELASRLGLERTPSAFQVRMGGGIKGLLMVTPFREYTEGRVSSDIIFTKSMHKASFDMENANLVVTGYSHPEKPYDTWNIQMLTMLDRQLGPEFVMGEVEKFYDTITRAENSPEEALAFLRVLEKIRPSADGMEFDEDDVQDAAVSDMPAQDEADAEERASNREKAAEYLEANPGIAFGLSWVKTTIIEEMAKSIENLEKGNVVMPETTTQYIVPDWLEIFNHMYAEKTEGVTTYNFKGEGDPVVPPSGQVKGLSGGQCMFHGKNGHGGNLLLARTPLTHENEICKAYNMAEDAGLSKILHWYRHQPDLVILNIYDEMALRMGGADFDGDKVKVIKMIEAVNAFTQGMLVNTISGGGEIRKDVLTMAVAQEVLLQNMKKNLLDECMVAAASNTELMNDFRNGGAMLLNTLAALTDKRFPTVKNCLKKLALELREKTKGLSAEQKTVLVREETEKTAMKILERDAFHYKGESGIVIDCVKTGDIPQFTHYKAGHVPSYRTSGQILQKTIEELVTEKPYKIKIITRKNRETSYFKVSKPKDGIHQLKGTTAPISMMGNVYSFIKDKMEVLARKKEKVGSKNASQQDSSINRIINSGVSNGTIDAGLLGDISADVAEINKKYHEEYDKVKEKYPFPEKGTRNSEARDKMNIKMDKHFRKERFDRLKEDTTNKLQELAGGEKYGKLDDATKNATLAAAALKSMGHRTGKFPYAMCPAIKNIISLVPKFEKVRLDRLSATLPADTARVVVYNNRLRLHASDIKNDNDRKWVTVESWKESGTKIPDGSYVLKTDRKTGEPYIVVPSASHSESANPGTKEMHGEKPKQITIDFRGAENKQNIDTIRPYMDGSHNITLTLSTALEYKKESTTNATKGTADAHRNTDIPSSHRSGQDKNTNGATNGKPRVTEIIEVWAQKIPDREGEKAKAPVKIGTIPSGYIESKGSDRRNHYNELRSLARTDQRIAYAMEITPPVKPQDYKNMTKEKQREWDHKQQYTNTGIRYNTNKPGQNFTVPKKTGYTNTIKITLTPIGDADRNMDAKTDATVSASTRIATHAENTETQKAHGHGETIRKNSSVSEEKTNHLGGGEPFTQKTVTSNVATVGKTEPAATGTQNKTTVSTKTVETKENKDIEEMAILRQMGAR